MITRQFKHAKSDLRIIIKVNLIEVRISKWRKHVAIYIRHGLSPKSGSITQKLSPENVIQSKVKWLLTKFLCYIDIMLVKYSFCYFINNS